MKSLEIIARGNPVPYGAHAFASYLNELVPDDPIAITFLYALPEKSSVQLDIDGQKSLTQIPVLEALAQAYAAHGVNGATPAAALEISTLIASLPAVPPVFGPSVAFLDNLDTRLTLRTFIVGHSLTVADFATFATFKINTVLSAGLKKGQHPHAARWYSFMETHPIVLKSVANISVASKTKPPSTTVDGAPKSNATFDLGLPNAIKGHVVTRFPPEPSGYLHIGHAKAAILNQFFAKLYEGKFLIRFDDTNPSKEKAEFEDSIVEDLALLGVKGDYVTHTSDYFDQLHKLCVQMIEEGNAYADDTEQEKMRDERMTGTPSARRDIAPSESLARFAEMATGSTEGMRWCIRAKISADNPNKAMRDPVIYRGNALPHHRTGDKYKVYPTYDFACPVVDCLEGVTHALRTNEYRDRNPQYQWMLDALKLRKVEVWDFGRVNFVHTLLSKRKLKWFVDGGFVRGWDDPRFPTVRGIRRRGMTIDALTQYMLIQGPSQAITTLEWDSIWSLNKKVIDPIAPRFVALETKNLVKVTLRGEGTPGMPELRTLPRHKKNPEVGSKEVVYSNELFIEQVDAQSFVLDQEITLMEWGNAYVRKITSNATQIESMEFELLLSGDYRKTTKITWLGSSPTVPFTPVLLLDYDYLITKKKLDEEDSVENFITPVTEFRVEAIGDANLRGLKKGDIIQFERKTYYIVDKAFGEKSVLEEGGVGEGRVECIAIPDGKVASIAFKGESPVVVPSAVATPKKKSVLAKEALSLPIPSSTPTPSTSLRIPEPAPTSAIETTLLSEGNSGFDIPVLTKMFRVPNVYGDDGVEAIAQTKMHLVKPVYDLA